MEIKIIGEEPLFVIDEKKFPITVDYSISISDAWKKVLKLVTWWGGVDLEKGEFPHAGLNRSKFICHYATLTSNRHLWLLGEELEKHGIIPADMMQLFVFFCDYGATEVTAEKNAPIVAAAPGSTWRCSHDVLRKMAGVEWSAFHHNPGPILHTVSQSPHDGFEKGTRFLAIEL